MYTYIHIYTYICMSFFVYEGKHEHQKKENKKKGF